jgi:predicted peptidase
MRKLLVTTLFLAAGLATCNVMAGPRIDPERITVSGISAGAQMAHQLHIAYSDVFSGAGLIAGGPYGCAEGSLATAMARCIGQSGSDLPVAELADAVRAAAAENRIADIDNLSGDRVWLFHGAQDTVVAACRVDLRGIPARRPGSLRDGCTHGAQFSGTRQRQPLRYIRDTLRR